MIKILFVCHGNICRSPMAEFVMKNLIKQKGLSHEFEISSAGTSSEEIGNPVYPPVQKLLSEHGISCAGKTARRLTKEDCSYYDHIICMDRYNLKNTERFTDKQSFSKVHLLMSFTNHPGDVADPWYTGDFSTTWNEINEGCEELLKKLKQNIF